MPGQIIPSTAQNENMARIAEAAEEYVRLHVQLQKGRGDRHETKGKLLAIVKRATVWCHLEVAYFCQQVVSHCGEECNASMCLTMFTNRLYDQLIKKD